MYKDRSFSLVQKAILYHREGILLLIKLLNKEELNILINNTDKLLDKFYYIVKNICSNECNSTLIQGGDKTTIYVIFPISFKNIEIFAHFIYSQIHVYTDVEYSDSYLKCALGSSKFCSSKNISVAKLLSNLTYGIINSQNQGFYYYSYDNNPINILKLKQSNRQLNLLREALRNNTIKFVYQPIVNSKTADVIYYECLLRMLDENNKYVSVGSIIAEAECKGLSSVIDVAVVEMVAQELKQDKSICLAVNISNLGVVDSVLLKKIKQMLTKYNIADRLIIEITETSINQDFIKTKHFIESLHEYGCRFALDDFGVGFTSFKQLLQLPIDIIKIDGSYIKDIINNKHSKFFVESLIKLSADLGIKTVAEFVENAEIAKCLININIDGMQGNFFLPASEKRFSNIK